MGGGHIPTSKGSSPHPTLEHPSDGKRPAGQGARGLGPRLGGHGVEELGDLPEAPDGHDVGVRVVDHPVVVVPVEGVPGTQGHRDEGEGDAAFWVLHSFPIE